jgi:hypothetical protein
MAGRAWSGLLVLSVIALFIVAWVHHDNSGGLSQTQRRPKFALLRADPRKADAVTSHGLNPIQIGDDERGWLTNPLLIFPGGETSFIITFNHYF